MTIRVRQEDKSLVESLLGRAQADYKEKIKKDVVLTIDPENFLPPNTCGGIELVAARGRIKVNIFIVISNNSILSLILLCI